METARPAPAVDRLAAALALTALCVLCFVTSATASERPAPPDEALWSRDTKG